MIVKPSMFNAMDEEVHDALQFAVGNCKIYSGTLDCKVSWDNFLQCWVLDCGELILMLSSQEVALEIVKQLSIV